MCEMTDYDGSGSMTDWSATERTAEGATPTATKERERLLRALFKRGEFLGHGNVDFEVEDAPRKPISLVAKCHPGAGLRARYFRSDKVMVLLCHTCSTPLGSVIPLDGHTRRKRAASSRAGRTSAPAPTPEPF